MISCLKRLPPAEWALYGACAFLSAIACAGPHVAQNPHYHAFADQRLLWGVPHALDVLTNLPFALAGAWGFWALARWARGACSAERAATAGLCGLFGLFFGGLLLTAVGSSVYHWQPHDATLLWDRAGMLVAFAGAAGLAVAGRIGLRAAGVAALWMLVAGTLALLTWESTGQFLPWAVVQGGGMLLVVALACLPHRPGGLHVSLGALIGWYALAKLLELGDHGVWHWTQGVVSGHSLKHVAAALAAWPVIAALNAAVTARTALGAARFLTGPYFAQCVRETSWRRPAAAAPKPVHTVAGAPRGAGTMAAGTTEGAAQQPGAAEPPNPPFHRSMA